MDVNFDRIVEQYNSEDYENYKMNKKTYLNSNSPNISINNDNNVDNKETVSKLELEIVHLKEELENNNEHNFSSIDDNESSSNINSCSSNSLKIIQIMN